MELRALNYTSTKIASMLDVSRATLYRRLKDAGIASNDRSHLSDAELDGLISSLKQDHPNDGEVLMQGHLVRMNIRVPRHALRRSIHRVDHENVVSRHHPVVRRVYSVPCPNYIWHIDGHHKMIHWRFVIHGGWMGFHVVLCFLNAPITIVQQQCLTSLLRVFHNLVSRIRYDQIGVEKMLGCGST